MGKVVPMRRRSDGEAADVAEWPSPGQRQEACYKAIRTHSLSLSEGAVLLYLAWRDGGKGAFAKNATICADIGANKDTVYKCCKKLVDLELVTAESEHRKPVRYSVLPIVREIVPKTGRTRPKSGTQNRYKHSPSRGSVFVEQGARVLAVAPDGRLEAIERAKWGEMDAAERAKGRALGLTDKTPEEVRELQCVAPLRSLIKNGHAALPASLDGFAGLTHFALTCNKRRVTSEWLYGLWTKKDWEAPNVEVDAGEQENGRHHNGDRANGQA